MNRPNRTPTERNWLWVKAFGRYLTGVALLLPLAALAQSTRINPETRLLTTSIRTGDTDIFWINPVTGDAFNITKAPASEERYPVWSPDGQQVVFTSNRGRTTTDNNPLGGAFNLYIANADGTNVRQLTKQAAPAVYYFPSWTADGKQIWFSLADDTQKKSVIGYVSPDGRDYKEIADGRDGTISPDGKTVAFTKQVGKGYCLFAMDADGRNVRQLSQHEDEIGAVAPAWSFDGKQIVYSDQVGEALELFVHNVASRQNRQVTKLGKISSSAAWSPDGKFITFRVTEDAYWRNIAARDKAYQDKRPDKRPVWVVGANGSDPHVIEVLRYHCAIDGSRAAWWPGK
ncbi:TolB family protein [Spirosoma soli]|uniref:TolB family protein n=1 Tax=Spirosoma soli TaxID=1770529 RepID=A0ABW5MDF4_9BACT